MRPGNAQSDLAKAFDNSANGAKRRSNATRPFSVRLSDAERQQLKAEAGAQSLGTYVRARLLDNAARRRASASVQDPAALSQILGKLGRLQLANSLSDLATAARVGAIAVTPELEQELRTVCRDVRDIRDNLVRALGLKPEARA